jgi:hypothetical protein
MTYTKGPDAVGVAEGVGVSVIVGVMVAVAVAVAVAVGVAVSVGVGVGVSRNESPGELGPVNQTIRTTMPTATRTMAKPPTRKGKLFCRFLR